MIERFRNAKQAEISRLQREAVCGRLPEGWRGQRPSFSTALAAGRRAPDLPAVVAEYKRASPSHGVLCQDLSPEEVAAQYAGAGAAALSVLTEETHFQGHLDHVARMTGPGLPVLRKDFLLDPVQIRATAATPAAAVLLIARMLTPQVLAGLHHVAVKVGLEPMVEVHDLADLEAARKLGVRCILVNNRDLESLEVDLGTCLRLAVHKAPEEVWIAASGLSTRPQLVEVASAGYDAVLVGSALMAGCRPGEALAALLAGVGS